LVEFCGGLEKENRDILTFLPARDYGPATKLIPTLFVETNPSSVIITIDDDIIYPPEFVSEFVEATRRYPNAALGLKGYRLPPKEEGKNLSHFNFDYYDSLNDTLSDVHVDVLGGFTGVAYRSGFFDYSRLTDYGNYPSGSFYVDDDWISGCLDDSGVKRIVLSNNTCPQTANFLFNSDVVTHVANIYSLNGVRTFRNRKFQRELLEFLREKEGSFLAGEISSGNFLVHVYDMEYLPLLGLRGGSFRRVFEEFEKSGVRNVTIVETGTTSATSRWPFSGQSTLLFDRWMNFHGNDGRLYSVDLDSKSCDIARLITSRKVSVHNGDSVEHLLDLNRRFGKGGAKTSDRSVDNDKNVVVDLIYLDSWDVSEENWKEENDHEPSLHAMKELAAIFGSLKRPGGMVLVDDNMAEGFLDVDDIRIKYKNGEYGSDVRIRGKGRYVNDFMEKDGGCKKLYHGWQLLWICE